MHSAFPEDKKLKPGTIAGWRDLKTLCKKWTGRLDKQSAKQNPLSPLSNSVVMYYVTLI